MPRISWDDPGERFYEAGLDRGVLYVDNQPGVPWNGLISVTEKPSGGTATAYYIDGEKYLNVASPEEFSGSISAFTYPDEFEGCDGTVAADFGLYVTNQPRKPFSFAYRTAVGNDEAGANLAYKLHLIYNALATPSQRANNTLTDSPSPVNFSWDFTTNPPGMPGFKPSAHVIIDTRIAHPGSVSDVENILYGTDTDAARIPMLDELIAIFELNATLRITYHGDGTWTAITSDDDTTIITMLDANTFQIAWDSAVVTGPDTYTLSSE
jgi:hypothetical protein